ncbi:MAG: tocopherol cyclase family protein [Cyanobacteria bacterium P01_A01_bin.3]
MNNSVSISNPLGDIAFPSNGYPHAGYHGGHRGWLQAERSFFEGWYFRITLERESFAFMYVIEESGRNDAGSGGDRSGGVMQVLGPGDELVWRSLPDARGFWADRTHLALGHWGGLSRQQALALVPRRLNEQEFFDRVPFGYQAGDRFNQGHFYLPDGDAIRWHYRIEPQIRYGSPQAEATMGWLSYLPVFEPGWQILLSRGDATGWIDWKGRRYDFVSAPAYAEKNWGGAFPLRWFWMQCNRFERIPSLSLTCAGGIRDVLGWQQSVGMVALHWHDVHWKDGKTGERFLKFVPENSRSRWRVSPWGQWEFEAESDRYRVSLLGHTDATATPVMVPTATGMAFECWDTTQGQLNLRVWERQGAGWSLLLEDCSEVAGLEVGGQGWDTEWVIQP